MPESQPQEPPEPDRDARGHGASDHSDAPGAPGPGALVLCGARLADGRTVDVRIDRGRIEAVAPAGGPASSSPPRATRIALAGHLLLPAPAEPHAHHDTALTAEPDAGPAPPSASGHGSRGPDDPGSVRRRTVQAALLQLGHGATALRTHVRIGDAMGLRALEAVLEARHALRGLVELTAVAVPRVLTGTTGSSGLAMLRDAVGMGASAVGGCPDLDPDPVGHARAVLETAAEHGCPADLHTRGADPVRLLRLAAMADGLGPKVTVGPCDGLARLPPGVTARTAEALAAAGITVVCLPQGGCGLLGRAAGDARTAPVRLLRAAGVRVAAGSGALRDADNPVGRGDPLEAAYLLASRGEADPRTAYEAVSEQARRAMGLPVVRIEAGFPAELLAVRGDTVAGALSLAYSRLVIHRGRVVARTSAVREYCDVTDGARPAGPADGHPATGPELPRQSQR
ncbi:hydrolase [Streptomyces taklimakanensis]|uniref:hydrolase n=1 Tax=Streptomyces taklimakanensis TaxID=2569853 RepID=UPI001EE47BD6|nr:hydrolase [Streptomyces taklimakanensis]